MAEDRTDEYFGSVGSKPLDERLWALKYQQAINGFPDPKDPNPDPGDNNWFGV